MADIYNGVAGKLYVDNFDDADGNLAGGSVRLSFANVWQVDPRSTMCLLCEEPAARSLRTWFLDA